MFNLSTRIPEFDYHSPALLDLFTSSDAIICSTVPFPPLGNSDHAVISVSTDSLQTGKGMPLFIAQGITILMLIGMIFLII